MAGILKMGSEANTLITLTAPGEETLIIGEEETRDLSAYVSCITEASLYMIDTKGNSMLILAVMYGLSSLVERLLDLGADPDYTNNAGQSARSLGLNQWV